MKGPAKPGPPQQVTLPSPCSPQVKPHPAAIWVKVPAGGVACPSSLFPAQATVPSRRNPQT